MKLQVYKRACIVTRSSNNTAVWDNIPDYVGTFEQWGVDFEELDNGPGSFSVAIVARAEGTFKLEPVSMIKKYKHGCELATHRKTTTGKLYRFGPDDKAQKWTESTCEWLDTATLTNEALYNDEAYVRISS